MGLAAVVQPIGAALQVTWRAVRGGPMRAIAYVRDNPARVLAVMWTGGLAAFVSIAAVRVYEVKSRESEAAEAIAKPPERDVVVAMLDIEEIEQLRDDRMRVNGLAAAGDKAGPTREEMLVAKQRRAKTAAAVSAAAGDEAGRAGNVVVVTKDGIAGWLERNKDKKPDPATLAWLRSQEKKDGRGAYAAWAGKDTTDLNTWFELDRERREGNPSLDPATNDVDPQKAATDPRVGSGAEHRAGDATPAIDRRAGASADGNAANRPRSSDGMTRAASVAGCASLDCRRPRRIDIGELGRGALAAVEPIDAEVVESLHRRIVALGWPAAITVTRYGTRVIVRVPASLMFAKVGAEPELSDVARQIVRELAGVVGTYEMRSVRITAAAGPQILELAAALVVTGMDPARLEAIASESATAIELELVPYRRRGRS